MPNEERRQKIYLTVVGPEAAIQSFSSAQHSEEIRVGTAQPVDSLSDAVDAPLGPEEIKLLFEFATVSLTLGAATIQFVSALIDSLKKSETAKEHHIYILDGRTNSPIAEIDEETSAEEVAKVLEDSSPTDK